MAAMQPRGDGKDQPAVQVVGGDEPQEPAATQRRWTSLPVVLPLLTFLSLLIIVGLSTGQAGSASTTIPAELISKPEPITVDARTSMADSAESGWEQGELDLTTRLGYVWATNSGFVALGYDIDGPGLWASSTGRQWSLTHRLGLPEHLAPAEMPAAWGMDKLRAVEWQDSTVVFGWLGEDATAVWLDAEFVGSFTTASHGLPFMTTPLAGEQLFATFYEPSESEAGSGAYALDEIWAVSNNGVDWERVSTRGLRENGSYPITWINGYFYAAGWCPRIDCLGSLYRSTNVVDWSRVDVELPGADADWDLHIADIAQMDTNLLAIGNSYRSDGSEPFAWRSASGDQWSLFPLDGAFDSQQTIVALESVDPTRTSATVAVDGVEIAVPEGSVIETDAGPFELLAINSDSVRVGLSGSGALLRLGEMVQLDRQAVVFDVEVAGPNIAIQGMLTTVIDGRNNTGYTEDAIWLSADGGATWRRTSLGDDRSWIQSMAVTADTVVLVGQENGTPRIWYREF